MIKLQSLNLYRGSKQLLNQAELSLYHGQHVGLVGDNGAGKTSLFALLTGELSADAGDVQLPSKMRIATVSQEIPQLDLTARQFVIAGHQQISQLSQQIAQAEQQQDYPQLAQLHSQLEAINGYQIASEAEQLLAGLGFQPAQYQRSVAQFSGGWRMRLNLARALIQPADLLLLDEPTNHLDLPAIIWLERWLQSYPGTLMVISHDQVFLDQLARYIVHIDQGKLCLYQGNYSAFERLRAARLAQQQATLHKQQKQVSHIQQFVQRFRAKATKARQVQSRLKALERLEKVELLHSQSPFHFRIRAAEKTTNPLLALEQASLGYHGRAVLTDVNLTINSGMRLGLLGSNGAGKSTLVKTLAGELPLVTGQLNLGKYTRVGYFAQHQLEYLDSEASPVQHLEKLSPTTSQQLIRNFLGGFNFIGDQAKQACGHFSGGEKARLALAILVWQRPNVLLLDEPTNHLDLRMRQALSLALQQYTGALVLVSHDRALLEQSCDEYLLVAQQQVQSFAGDMTDYSQQLRQKPAGTGQSATKQPAKSNRQQRQASAQQRQRLQKLKHTIKQLEQQLAQQQQDLAQIEQTLANPELYSQSASSADKDKLKLLLAEQRQLSQAVNTSEEKWLDLVNQLEQLE